MDEYISREALIDVIELTNWYHAVRGGKLGKGATCRESAVYKATDIYKAVDSVPTADVVKVRHGAWIGKPIAGMCTVRCSACGMAFSENSGRWLYCPNCGAKMDGKRKDGAE